jgi:hypothetical protein
MLDDVDLSGNHNTGLAIGNIMNTASSIAINAFQMDGVTSVGTSPCPLPLAANGHYAKLVDQFIAGLPAGFKGIIDIGPVTPLPALTIRSLTNERHDFLMTTFPIANANQAPPLPIAFPQIADGGGYVTQFILLSSAGQSSAILGLYDDTGTVSWMAGIST